MKSVYIQLGIAADSQLPNPNDFSYWGRRILAESAHFLLFLSKFLVHFSFTEVETKTRHVQTALAKKSVVIKGINILKLKLPKSKRKEICIIPCHRLWKMASSGEDM